MTEEEMAKEYVDTLLNKDDIELDKFLDENLKGLKLNEKQVGTLLGIIKGVGICSFLAGLKAGKPKWHKVADGDLPKGNDAVLIYWKFGDKKCASVVEPYKVTGDKYVIAWKEIVLPEGE